MTDDQRNALIEIQRLLREAYDDYFARSDGHCKPYEGYVGVRYPNYFERDEFAPGEACGIGIYSYVLGPSRMHEFSSFDIALAMVRDWHKRQLESDPEDAW